MRFLQWEPRQQVHLDLIDNVIVVFGADAAQCRSVILDARCYLRLPAEIRSYARLYAGDRLLIVADRTHNLLAAYSPFVLSDLLRSAAPRIWAMSS
ncbi:MULTISPECIES: hypothetical protein [unclassified Nocardia]|uniref:hypothetical protein n=1 Tax=unclassified Nocardia TaxID=2637762 RepID=UPI001CE485A0|nr:MULTISPECIES: hypothetical protein [unclassified Nocardia]